jgi:hypothetical protein
MLSRVRAKAGLPWPVTGVYSCDKCHSNRFGEAGVIVARCTVRRVDRTGPCNCAYFALVEKPDPVNEARLSEPPR